MGASVAAAAATGGARVFWSAAGRSAATRERAERAGLLECPDVQALCERCRVVLSVCPPEEALGLARTVSDLGFAGTYVDANAVSPATARKIAAVFDPAAVSFVDGGLIGPPAWKAGSTRLHLSGPRAAEVAALFAGSPLETKCVGDEIGAASALKMVFAAQTKGTTALLAAIVTVAEANGVRSALFEEWEQTQPGLVARSQGMAPMIGAKAWRFEGEMREIAATFEAAGLPAGFHTAAAEVYGRLAGFKEGPPPDLAALIQRLRESSD